MTRGRPHLLPLRGPIKTYAWGSRTVLAGLAGRAAPAVEPEAELWIGAHAQGAAEVAAEGGWASLREAIAAAPLELLGARAFERFGAELPFLLKVLAIERPLSLQVHPDRARAAAGFERERAARVALEEGSYRDARHKPELVVALEPLWVLHGLLDPGVIRQGFAAAGLAGFAGETAELVRRGSTGLRDFLAALLGVAGDRRRRLLEQARAAAAGRPRGNGDERASPLYWLERLLDLHPEDPAALSPLLFHVVGLVPGEGLYQAPGVLHCYLAGAAVEVMASSDNVVRAGLTGKPVDVAEALAVADLTPAQPATVAPLEIAPGVARYPTGAEEFQLLRLEPSPSAGVEVAAPDALVLGICTRGEGLLAAPLRGERLALRSGAAFAVRPGGGILRLDGDLCVYASTVPGAPSARSAAAGDAGGRVAPW